MVLSPSRGSVRDFHVAGEALEAALRASLLAVLHFGRGPECFIRDLEVFNQNATALELLVINGASFSSFFILFFVLKF